jgi:hypothetical protein
MGVVGERVGESPGTPGSNKRCLKALMGANVPGIASKRSRSFDSLPDLEAATQGVLDAPAAPASLASAAPAELEAPAQGVLAAPTAPASLATAAPAELEAPAHHLGVLAAPAAPASLATAAPAHAAPNLPLPEVTPPSGSAAPSGATLLDAMLERDTERKAAAAAAKKAEKEALKAAKEKEEAAAAAAKKAEKEALEPIKAATAKEEVDDKGEAEKPVASCKAEAKKPATPKQSVAPTKLVDAEAEVKSAQPKKASCKIGAKKRIGVNHEGSICQYLARSATISKGFKYGPGKTYETAELAKEAAAAWLDTMRTTSAQG